MKQRWQSIAVWTCIPLLAACAGYPLADGGGTGGAENVPALRIVDPSFLRPKPDAAVLTIQRNRAQVGSACSARLFVNARPVADMRVGEKLVIHLAEGDYTLSAWPTGVCPGNLAEMRLSLRPGDALNLRIGYQNSGEFAIGR